MKLEVLQERSVYSSFLLIEASATNVLIQNRATTQLKEGPDAYRSVFALQDILLNRKSQDIIGDPSQSVLTFLLRDVLFGHNVVCTVLLHLSRGEPAVTSVGLKLLEGFESISLAPNHYTPSVQNLQQSLRRELLLMRRIVEGRKELASKTCLRNIE